MPAKPLVALTEIADWALDDLTSDCTDAEVERLEAMRENALLRYYYTAAECDVFAFVLHQMTGWPVIGYASFHRGALHRLVRAPDGRLLDAHGWTDLARLDQRYGCYAGYLTPPGGPELCVGLLEDDLDDTGFYEGFAAQYAASAIRQLPWGPFTTARLRQLTARPVPGVDVPVAPERMAA